MENYLRTLTKVPSFPVDFDYKTSFAGAAIPDPKTLSKSTISLSRNSEECKEQH